MNTCANNCGRPTPHANICPTCITDLTDRLDDLTPDDLHHLHQIAHRQAEPATHNATRHTTSNRPDALNLAVWTLWHDLTTTIPNLPPYWTHQSDAPTTYRRISASIDTANDLLHGTGETTITAEHLTARMAELPTLPPRQLAEWLHRRGLTPTITARRIQKWAERGQITPTKRTPTGRALYHPADALRALDNSRAR